MTHPLISQLEKNLAGKTRLSLDPADPVYSKTAHASWKKDALAGLFKDGAVLVDVGGKITVQDTSLSLVCSKPPVLNVDAFGSATAQKCWLEFAVDTDKAKKNSLTLLLWIKMDGKAPLIRGLYQPLCPEYESSFFAKNLRITEEAVLYNGGPALVDAASRLRFEPRPGADKEVSIPSGPGLAAVVNNLVFLPFEFASKLSFAFTAPWQWKKPAGKAAGATGKIPPALTLTSSRIDGTAKPVSFMTIATPKLVVDLKGEEKKEKKKEKNERGKSAPAAGDKQYALKSSFTLIANGTVSLPRPFAVTVSAAYLPASDGSTASMKVVGDIVSKDLPNANDIATLTGISNWGDLVPTKYAEYVKTIGLKRVGYTTQVQGKEESDPSELAVTIQSEKTYRLHTGFLADMDTTLGIDWARKTEKATDGKGKKITTTTNVTATGTLFHGTEAWVTISFTLKNDTAFTGYVAVLPHGPDKSVTTMTIPEIVGILFNNAVPLDWMDKVVSLPLSKIDLALDKSAGTVSISAKDLAPTITLFTNKISAGSGTLSLDLVKPTQEKKEIKESSKFQFASDIVRLRLQSDEKGDTIAAELGNPKKPDDSFNVLALLENVLQADFHSKDFVIGVKSASLETFTAREEKKRGNDKPANSDDKEYKFRHAITGEAVLAVKEGALPGFSGSLGVKLDAAKSRYRKKGGKATGFTDAMLIKASSRLDMNIAKLPNLSLGLDIAYAKESPASDAKTTDPIKADLTTTLTWKDLSLSCDSGHEQTIYKVEFAKADWNLGRLVKNLLSAIGVGRDKAELYEPWNILYTIPLNNVNMQIVVKKSGENEVSLNLKTEWKLFFLTLESIGLKYAKRDGSYRLSAIVSEKSTGHSETIDIVNADKPEEKPAPAAKSKAPKDMFTLNMLAVGRRMALIQSTAGVESVSTALDGIAAFIGKNAPAYADDVGWIFAADCAFNQKMIRLGLILYDPWLYGLHIEVTAGEFLKGLSFDILYKKLSDTLGVFKAQLVLPDRIRHLDFGGLAITLPVFALDVYTNGDFRVDIGFPWNGDFSRSGALTYGIFTGQAGIFFGVLSGATSNMVPKATVGSFKPVIEAGVGFTFFVGLNKTYGPASIIVGLGASAIIQGCYAKWSDPAGRTDAFYKVSGYLAVFGTISAKLDIKIISFEFSITVMISAALALEAYSKSHVRLDADLSITLKVRVLFFKVNFHFNYHFTYSLEFGSDKPKPWFINNREMAALPTAREIDSFIPNFAPLKTGKAGKTAALLHFCPQRLPDSQAIACLFTDAGSTTVRSMLETTLRWYLSSFSERKSGSMDPESADACTLSRQRLQRAREYLETHEYDNPAATMRYEHLEETLANIFTHTFKPLPIASNDTSAPGTMNPFPMIPSAYMYIKVGAEAVREVRFDAEPDVTAQRAMGELLRSRQRTAPSERALADPDTRVPMARIMYFASFITALGTLTQALNPDEMGVTASVGEMLRLMSSPEKSAIWNDAAGLFAGSVYGGLQAKKPGGEELVSAFTLSRQQFPAGAGALGLDLALTARATPDIPADRIWPDKVLADHAYAKTDTVPIVDTHLLPQAVSLPRQFLLTSGSAYADRAGGQTWCIYPSPAVLPKAMAALPSRPTFTIYRDRKDQNAAPNRADAVSGGAEPVSGWKWALALDCLVVRQPGRKDVFKVIGVDDAGVQALEQMGFGNPFAAGTVYDLSLAWPADPAAGENAPLAFDSNLDHLSLARIDCEKETKPLTRGATVSDNVFVIGNTLLEASRVRASGCYLRYAAGTAFLPDGIFDEQGKTTLTFLFRYRQDGAAATPALFNRIMIAGGAEAGFDLFIRPTTEVPTLVESVATVAQGSVGFRIDVGDMENAPAAAYNLLTCRPAGKWDEGTIDPAQFPIIRPTKKPEGQGTGYEYVCTLPLADMLANNAPDKNPYAGVGKTYALDLVWLDAFGNATQAGGKQLTFAPKYTDNVTSLSSLPGTVFVHTFEKNKAGKPCVAISLRFGGVPEKATESATEAYRTAARQLREKVKEYTHQLALQVSFSGKPIVLDGAVRDLLIGYADACVASLTKGQPAAPAATISVPVTAPSAMASLVEIALTISRDSSLVLEGLQNDANKTSSLTVIPPNCMMAKNSGQPAARENAPTILEYEQSFIAAFGSSEGYRIATGVRLVDGERREELWVLRTTAKAGDKTGKLYIDEKAARSVVPTYSPRPLSTELLRFADVQEYAWQNGKLEKAGTGEYTDVDLDKWLDTALARLETSVSPEVALACTVGSEAGSDPLQILREAKDAVAANLSAALIGMQDDAKERTTAIIPVAKERFVEEMRGGLTRYAHVPAVAGLTFAVASGDGSPVNLFGRLGQPQSASVKSESEQETVYSFSHFKAKTADNGNAAAALRMDAPETIATVDLPRMATITHIEFPPTGRTDRPPAWLELVRPLSVPVSAAEKNTICVPLRRYPEKPRLLRQWNEAAGGSGFAALMDWAYVSSYARRSAMQDTLTFDLFVNPAHTAVRGRDADPRRLLFERLVHCNGLLAGMADTLQAQAEAVLAGGGDAAAVRASITAIADMLKNIGAAFAACFSASRNMTAPVGAEKYVRVEIGERAGGGSMPVLKQEYRTVMTVIQSHGWSGSPPVLPGIEGWETQKVGAGVSGRDEFRYVRNGIALTVGEAAALGERRLRLSGLHAIRDIKVRTTVNATRNTQVPDIVKPYFVYTTPVVGYDADFSPIHEYGAAIDLTEGKPIRLDDCLRGVVETVRAAGITCQMEFIGRRELLPGVGVESPLAMIVFDSQKAAVQPVVESINAWRNGSKAGDIRMRLRLVRTGPPAAFVLGYDNLRLNLEKLTV